MTVLEDNCVTIKKMCLNFKLDISNNMSGKQLHSQLKKKRYYNYIHENTKKSKTEMTASVQGKKSRHTNERYVVLSSPD